jgi:hypothetical protein
LTDLEASTGNNLNVSPNAHHWFIPKIANERNPTKISQEISRNAQELMPIINDHGPRPKIRKEQTSNLMKSGGDRERSK